MCILEFFIDALNFFVTSNNATWRDMVYQSQQKVRTSYGTSPFWQWSFYPMNNKFKFKILQSCFVIFLLWYKCLWQITKRAWRVVKIRNSKCSAFPQGCNPPTFVVAAVCNIWKYWKRELSHLYKCDGFIMLFLCRVLYSMLIVWITHFAHPSWSGVGTKVFFLITISIMLHIATKYTLNYET